MKTLSAQNLAALKARAITARDFVSFTPRNWSNNATAGEFGFWTGIGDITASMIDPDTNTASDRVFVAAGQLLQIFDIESGPGMIVRELTIAFSGLVDASSILRKYNVKRAEVIVWRGLMTLDAGALIAPGYPRFQGFIDHVGIERSGSLEGAESTATIRCVSSMIDLTIAETGTKSDEYMRQRSATDTFRQHSPTVGEWEVVWGEKSQ